MKCTFIIIQPQDICLLTPVNLELFHKSELEFVVVTIWHWQLDIFMLTAAPPRGVNRYCTKLFPGVFLFPLISSNDELMYSRKSAYKDKLSAFST